MTDAIPRPTDREWEDIHSVELSFGACWENCDSYCCKTNHELQNLRLMKKESAGMVFMEGEYAFLERTNRLQEGFAETARHHAFRFDGDKTLHFVTAVCDLGGMCSNPDWRPLICKFYPYLPHVDPATREIDGFIAGSALDQYWADLGYEHPCWLLREKGDLVQSALRTAQPFLQHPYFIFYLGAASLFMDRVQRTLRREHPELLEGDPRVFFAKWELLYLSGALVDRAEFTRELATFHRSVTDRIGEFVL